MERKKASKLFYLLLLLALISNACGGDSGGGESTPSIEDGLPAFTTDYGDFIYALYAEDSEGKTPTSVGVYSDGIKAVVIIAVENAIENPASARLVGNVTGPDSIEMVMGEINLDGDNSFSNNELLQAEGTLTRPNTVQVLASGDGIKIGGIISLKYTFAATLLEIVPLNSSYGFLIYGDGYPYIPEP